MIAEDFWLFSSRTLFFISHTHSSSMSPYVIFSLLTKERKWKTLLFKKKATAHEILVLIGADPGFLENGLVCIKVLGFALLILSPLF